MRLFFLDPKSFRFINITYIFLQDFWIFYIKLEEKLFTSCKTLEILVIYLLLGLFIKSRRNFKDPRSFNYINMI